MMLAFSIWACVVTAGLLAAHMRLWSLDNDRRARDEARRELARRLEEL